MLESSPFSMMITLPTTTGRTDTHIHSALFTTI